jgi:hypothetical protein
MFFYSTAQQKHPEPDLRSYKDQPHTGWQQGMPHGNAPERIHQTNLHYLENMEPHCPFPSTPRFNRYAAKKNPLKAINQKENLQIAKVFISSRLFFTSPKTETIIKTHTL